MRNLDKKRLNNREKITKLKNKELKIRLDSSIMNIEEAIKCISDIDYLFIDRWNDDGLTTALNILTNKRQQLYSLRDQKKKKKEVQAPSK